MIRQRITVVLFILLCSLGSLVSIWQVSGWGNGLSQTDAGTEANILREVRHFREDGLLQYDGLGNIRYPGMYPDDGITEAYLDNPSTDASETDYLQHHVLSAEGVYTHYPPGPEYLTFTAAKLFGFEPVWRLRLLPIAIGGAAMIFLGMAVRHRFSPQVGWLVMAALAITPAVNDVFVGLHPQSYALALLLFEIGVAIGAGAALLPFAVLGFLQGWLSFDYVFLVCLTPLAIEAAMSHIDTDYARNWSLAWRRTIVAAIGFSFAHVLHFAEVWAYWGNFGVALHDIAFAAQHRAGATEGIVGHARSALQLLNNYYIGAHPFSPYLLDVPADRSSSWLTFRFLGLSLGPWWILLTATFACRQFLVGDAAARALADDWLWASLPGILLSSAWFMVMVNHGLMHQAFIYRQLFLGFFVCVLFGAVRLSRYLATVSQLQPAE